MNTEQILMCVVALILGMLLANMLKSVCGCKVVEGQGQCMSVSQSDAEAGIFCSDKETLFDCAAPAASPNGIEYPFANNTCYWVDSEDKSTTNIHNYEYNPPAGQDCPAGMFRMFGQPCRTLRT